MKRVKRKQKNMKRTVKRLKDVKRKSEEESGGVGYY